MVINQKMTEKEMDNHGSKSEFISFNSVKDQRINDSWCIEQWLIHLRYILNYLEINKLVKNFSKQLNKRCTTRADAKAWPLRGQPWLNYKIFLSNFNQRRSYSNNSKNNQLFPSNLHPWFITGFTHAEGCFSVSIVKNPVFSTGWDSALFSNKITSKRFNSFNRY